MAHSHKLSALALTALILSGCSSNSEKTEAPAQEQLTDNVTSQQSKVTHTPDTTTKPQQVSDLWQLTRDNFQLDLTLDNERVQQQVKWYARHPQYLQRVANRASRYYHHILHEIIERGLPAELALLPVVESAYDPFAYSHGRAAGPWQFIPSTGKYFGLQQNWWFDERRDILSSTNAALNYLEKLNKRYKVLKERKDKDSMDIISDLAGEAQTDFQKYQIGITEKYPKSMTALIINLIREPEVPDPPKAEMNGEPVDTAFWQYLWYKKHYWDYVDFSDDRIVRTPVFKEKVMKYIGPKLTAQIPDTICETGQKFIDATREGNKFVYRNVLTWIVSKYEESNIMGMNAVVCCLAQKYYINDPECDWLKPRKKQKFVDHIAKECNVVIGKQARDLVMMDLDGVPRSLHAVPSKYTVVYFYSATCGHCKKITPKVHKLYKEYKDKGLAVYSVNVDYKEVKDDDGNIINLIETKDYREYVLKNKLEWINVADPLHQTKFRDHYNIYSTPVIYLLDENKNFIGVRLDSVTLRRMIMHEIDGMSHEDIDVWLEENGYSADEDEDTGDDEHEGHDHGDEGSNH